MSEYQFPVTKWWLDGRTTTDDIAELLLKTLSSLADCGAIKDWNLFAYYNPGPLLRWSVVDGSGNKCTFSSTSLQKFLDQLCEENEIVWKRIHIVTTGPEPFLHPSYQKVLNWIRDRQRELYGKVW